MSLLLKLSLITYFCLIDYFFENNLIDSFEIIPARPEIVGLASLIFSYRSRIIGTAMPLYIVCNTTGRAPSNRLIKFQNNQFQFKIRLLERALIQF